MRRNIPRGFELALLGTSLLWALAASIVAGKAAHGIALRFRLDALEPMMSAVFLVFLAVLGFQVLDWVSTQGGERVDALPLPGRTGWTTEWGVGAAIGWGLCLMAVLPVLLTRNLHGRVSLSGVGSRVPAIGIAALTLLAVTLAEEVIARGYPFQRLAAAVGPSWAAVLSSVGFAGALVWAGSPENFWTAMGVSTLFGLVLAMAYLRTHALWVGWGLHFGFRAVMALVIGLPVAGHGEFASVADVAATGPRWLTGGAYGLDAAVLTGLGMLVGMGVLYRATREYAWAYTAPMIVGAGYEVAVAPPAAHVAMERSTAVAPPPLVQIQPVTSQSATVISHDESGMNIPPR